MNTHIGETPKDCPEWCPTCRREKAGVPAPNTDHVETQPENAVPEAFDAPPVTGERAIPLNQAIEEVLAEETVGMLENPRSLTHVQRKIVSVCRGIEALLLEKNRKYGNSVIEPISIFSKATPLEQACVRLDDKLKRIKTMGTAAAPDEDTVKDLIGYSILVLVLRELEEEEKKP